MKEDAGRERGLRDRREEKREGLREGRSGLREMERGI